MEPTENLINVNTMLRRCIYVMYALYALLSFATLHNLIRFVIGQRRYKFFHIAYFYILCILIILARVIWFTMILDYLHQTEI